MRLAPFLIATALAASPAVAQSIEGMWRTQPSAEGAFLVVRIAPCSGRVCGEVAEVVGSPRTDIVGRVMIAGMAPDGPGAWSGGTIWAPDDDRTYRARMSLTAPDALKVEGCVLVICRGQTWSRQE